MSAASLPSCRELIEVLCDYLDGALPAEHVARLERHLAVCPSCVAYLATYRETIVLARHAAVADEMPEELVRAIVAAGLA